MAEYKINRFVALGVFLSSFIVYMMTLSATVVFWDVGEFIAAAWLLQVPHPPGSPLFLLLGRVVAMVPFLTDIAARVHAISALSGSLAVMFMYLNAVKLITRFRGIPGTLADRLTVYGGAAIGGLAMAFSGTFWDNGTEAEVYGLSMLFVSLVLWLALHWWENADEPHSEKYILIIAYLIGLSSGVHLLSLLAIFTVMMIFYFRRYDYNRQNIIRLILIGVPVFFVIYPGIAQFMPSMLDGDFAGIKSDLWIFMPPLITIVVAYFAWKTHKTGQKWFNIAALSFLLIVLGYTTYVGVIMRSNVHPPMNENNPSNLARLVSYLNREQYGNTPLLRGESWDNDLQNYRTKLFPRRWSQEAMHEPTRANYTSDMDFLWRYQINHMFLRYLFQNYIGPEGDWQDAGVSWKETWGIPFLIGLFGFIYHFRRDWRNFLPIFVLFLVMGLVFVFYANMQEPQPRERDYFFVGAFYAFCIWIGIGVVGMIDLLRERAKSQGAYQMAASGVLLFSFVTVPVSLVRMNYHEQDRSKNYVAWDYSYNLLQSCDQDAILFTNGDNDTFPLWYLQDVEGVRRDVRIANLSLINTNWYIAQLKNETPHGARKVPVSFSDQQIETMGPILWRERKMDIPVTADALRQFAVKDSTVINSGKISFTMSGVAINAETRILRVQDIMVRDIIMANKWERPINFAVTCSPDAKIGLDNYLWMQGMVWRLKPIPVNDAVEGGIDPELMAANYLAKNVTPSKTYQPGFLYRNLNNPDVYYDENITRMIGNYRAGFLTLASYAVSAENNRDKAKGILDQMEQTIPIDLVPNTDWRYTYRMMSVANYAGATELFNKYSTLLEEKLQGDVAIAGVDRREQTMAYQALLEIYDGRRDYAKALDVLGKLDLMFPNDPTVQSRMQTYRTLLSSSAERDSARR